MVSKFLDLKYRTMPFRLFVPEGYHPNKSYPLVLFLHGGGERGDDNIKQLINNDCAIFWARPENQSKSQTFVLAPQSRSLPEGGFGITRDMNNNIDLSRVFEFSNDLQIAYEILQKVKSNYHIDEKRIYATGISQGSFGTYSLNIKYPNLFAAMVPIAGGGNPQEAQVLVKKPLWNFHAEGDQIIPVSFSRNIIEAIIDTGGKPIYTEYPAKYNYNHASWVPAYKNPRLFDWVMKQENNR